MLLNLSNHPAHDPKRPWSKEHLRAAEKAFGLVEDVEFPNVPPEWGAEEVAARADEL